MPPTAIAKTSYNHTDLGNAEYFAASFPDKIKYDYRRSRWLIWAKHYWKEDDNGQIIRMASNAIRQRFRSADKIKDQDKRQKEIKWTLTSEGAARIEAMINLAKSLKEVADSGENWDSDHYLLGVKNGVIDLRTGVLRDGRMEDRITRICPFEYKPTGTYTGWTTFLSEILDNNVELIEWLQRAVGYSLTGATSEKKLFFLYGAKGNNGKSTFIETISGIMGGYAIKKLPIATLMNTQPKGEAPTPFLAQLADIRFVATSEMGESKKLNEELVKDLTGGMDTVSVRELRKSPFQFKPQFKIWMFGNYKPIIKGTDNAIWERVGLIPFLVSIPEHKRNKGLEAEFRAHYSDILAWAIEGTRNWLCNGLAFPECIKREVAEYRQEMNPLSEFLHNWCQIDPTFKVSVDEMWKSYHEWAKSVGEKFPLGRQTFIRRLESLGYERKALGVKRTMHWIGLQTTHILDPEVEDDLEKEPLFHRN